MSVRMPSLSTDDKIVGRGMADLINRDRTKRGLAPLQLKAGLGRVARAHAADMLKRGYMSHFSPEGHSVADRMNRAGILWRSVGENLAGSPTLYRRGTPVSGYRDFRQAHDDLMHSPGHRANILGAFQFVGIGTARNADGTLIIVQVFTSE